MQRDPSRRNVKSFKWSRVFEEKLIRVAEAKSEKEQSQKTNDESIVLRNDSVGGSKARDADRAKTGAQGRLGLFVQDYMRCDNSCL